MDHAVLTEKKGTGLLKSTLLSLLFSFVFALCSLLLASAILLHYKNPTSAFRAVGILLPSLTSFFGGIMAGKIEKKQGALAGILHGALILLALFLLSCILGQGELSPLHTAISYTILLLLSTLGGTLGGARHTKGKKRRHKRR